MEEGGNQMEGLDRRVVLQEMGERRRAGQETALTHASDSPGFASETEDGDKREETLLRCCRYPGENGSIYMLDNQIRLI
jgi:hypothetical protein